MWAKVKQLNYSFKYCRHATRQISLNVRLHMTGICKAEKCFVSPFGLNRGDINCFVL